MAITVRPGHRTAAARHGQSTTAVFARSCPAVRGVWTAEAGDAASRMRVALVAMAGHYLPYEPRQMLPLPEAIQSPRIEPRRTVFLAPSAKRRWWFCPATPKTLLLTLTRLRHRGSCHGEGLEIPG